MGRPEACVRMYLKNNGDKDAQGKKTYCAAPSCKAHKIIHTKARNRLYTETVQLLFFTYINLRILNKCTADMGDFLTQTLAGCDDEGSLAAGESDDAEEPEEAVVDLTLDYLLEL